MKTVSLKAYLVAAFCLIVFAGFTQAQIKGSPPVKAAKAESNEVKLASQKRRLEFQKQTMVKRWRQLKPGMTEKQVERILDKPKLAQSGSHECVWFYQDVPESNAVPNFKFKEGDKQIKVEDRYETVVEKIGVSDVGGVKHGIVFFEAKSLDSLVEELKAKRDKIIAKEKARYDGRLRVRPTDEETDERRRKSSRDRRARLRDETLARSRDENIERPRYERRVDTDERRVDTRAVRRAEKYYNMQVKKLRESPRPPVLLLRFLNQPDWDRFEDLLASKKPDRTNTKKETDKWKDPLRWRKLLKINMTLKQVHALLGEPKETKPTVEATVEYYGRVFGHGELHFSARSDLEDRLDSWIEPFWPAADKELAAPPTVPPVSKKRLAQDRAIGISYDQVMKYLSNFFLMGKSTSVDGQERYMGQTSDNLAMLEIIGNKNNISQATLIVGAPNDAADIVARNSAIVLRFLKNTVPEWRNSSDWATATLNHLIDFPDSSKRTVIGNKLVTMKFLKPLGMVILTVEHK